MQQAKFSLTEDQIRFVNQHAEMGFANKSALIREALEQMKARVAQERLAKSAQLYSDVYDKDNDLCQLTETALEDWPR